MNSCALTIKRDDLNGPEIAQLLAEHLRAMAEVTPAESRHVLDLEELRRPGITFWSVWQGPVLAGCGALQELDATHGEVKSMRTAKSHLRKGVASRVLAHIITEAQRRGYQRLSLETGAMAYFRPAHALYRKHGFTDCPPFADYGPDPNSVFMTRKLPAGDDFAIQALRTRETLQCAVQHATRYLDELDGAPVATTATLGELRTRLGKVLPEEGTDPSQVIDELVAGAAGGQLGSAGGRFFAWVIGGSLPAALGADWLTSAWDQNTGLYACAPAAAVVEEVAGAWLKDLLGLPDEASFAFTSGCQLAHFTCLAAARFAVLRDAGWEVDRRGLFGAPPIRVITSGQRHVTVDRALRFLGFGQDQLEVVAEDENGEINLAKFQEILPAKAGPAMVVLNAGDLNQGAFDSFAKVIPVAKAAGAWVHVDGAFGLMARASRLKRPFLAGVERADSWATDGHKWLNVPYDSGLAFVRDQAAHRASMTARASYIAPDSNARDPLDWTPEFSRRARGFALYAALRELGRRGLENLIDRCCAHAHALVTGIGRLTGAEMLWEPSLNQGLVRFLDPRPTATGPDHDARTDAVIAAVNASGETFFSGTIWRGKRAMRVSVVNWRTTERDVSRSIAAVAAVLAGHH